MNENKKLIITAIITAIIIVACPLIFFFVSVEWGLILFVGYIIYMGFFDTSGFVDLFTEAKEEGYKTNMVANCPNCNSCRTEKISTVGRATSIYTFGLASSSIGKQYKCNDCGHKW